MADTGGRDGLCPAPRPDGTRGAAGKRECGGPGQRPSGAPAPGGREIFATAEGITVYPPRAGGGRWRAVWYEPDGQRGQCQAVTEGRLTAKLEPVAERLAAEAPNTLRKKRELITHYLLPDRLPPERQWSRKHTETHRYLCARFIGPVIGHLGCQHIKVAHLQAAVNAAPTAGEGRRLRSLISALVGAGIAGGFLTSARLKDVHWQAHGRPVTPVRSQVAGESVLYVDPGEIPGPDDVTALGQAVAAARGWVFELMVVFAAYSGLRWGELAALTATQIGQAQRLVAVDRKVVEIRGHLFVEPVRAENLIHGSDLQSCSPGAPPVTITGHGPAVRVPLDHAASRVAAAVPA